MGRPVEVCDEDVIAAGVRLESRGVEVKSSRLRTELGERGRPKRMIAIWAEHVAGRVRPMDVAAAATSVVSEPPCRLADGLTTKLGVELGRIVKAIHDEVRATATSKFQDAFAAMDAERAAHLSKTAEALDTIGRLEEQRDSAQATLRQVERDAAAARRECSLRDALLTAAAEERTSLEKHVAALRETVESERSKNGDLRVALMRAETWVENCATSLALLGQTLRAPKGREVPKRSGDIGLRPTKPLRVLSKLPRRGARRADDIAFAPDPAQDVAYQGRRERPS